MIKELSDLIKWIFKIIAKGILYCIKGVSWFSFNFSNIVKDCSNLNEKKNNNLTKREEIL